MTGTGSRRSRPARPGTGPAQDEAADEAALAAARGGLAARPNEPQALFTLAALLLRARHPDAAALLPQLDRHPDFAGGWLTVGDALLACGQAGASLAAVQRGMRALSRGAPSSTQAARASHLLGRALRAAGRDDEAGAAFEHGVGLDPLHAAGWYSLAVLRQDQERDADAADAYRSALAAEPGFHEAALNLGVALGECGRMEEALDAYATALALRPDSFGRIAQSLVSGRTGLLFLDPGRLRTVLKERVRQERVRRG